MTARGNHVPWPEFFAEMNAAYSLPEHQEFVLVNHKGRRVRKDVTLPVPLPRTFQVSGTLQFVLAQFTFLFLLELTKRYYTIAFFDNGQMVKACDHNSIWLTMRPATKAYTEEELRKMWHDAGGRFHGPNVEQAIMPEYKLIPFLRKLLADAACEPRQRRARL